MFEDGPSDSVGAERSREVWRAVVYFAGEKVTFGSYRTEAEAFTAAEKRLAELQANSKGAARRR